MQADILGHPYSSYLETSHQGWDRKIDRLVNIVGASDMPQQLKMKRKPTFYNSFKFLKVLLVASQQS